MAECERVVAHAHTAAQHGGDDDARRLVGVEDGDVVVGVGRLDRGARLTAVRVRERDAPRVLYDVQGGEDLALGVDDDTRTERGVVGVAEARGFDHHQLRAHR